MAGAWQPSKAAALAGLGVHTWKLLAVEATSGAVPLLTGTILPAAGAGLARLLVSAPETPASPVSQRRRSHKLAETSEERPLAVLAGAGGQRATKRGSRILDFESASITSPRRFLSTSFASGRLMRKQSRRTGAEAKAVSTHEQPGITTLRCNLTNSRHSAAQRCLEPSQSVRLSFDELGGMLRQGQGQLDTGMEGARRQQMKPTLDDMDPSEPLMWYPRRAPGRLPPHVTFYKRSLPAPSIAFSSDEGKRLWTQALLDGTADCYFKLSEQFITQAEPAYCGLTSLAMVLNTLSIDPRRTWKGVWRWYVEDMVRCCTPLSDVAENGVTFQEVISLAQCNGAAVEAMPYGSFSQEEFRQIVADVCSQSEKFLIVSYSRQSLNQSGHGHFSPVGAYNAKSDHVLILDVARFKYPPHWVPLPDLYKAMALIDAMTGLPRGAMLLSRKESIEPVLFTLDTRVSGSVWKEAHHYFAAELPGVAAKQIASAMGRGRGSCSVAFSLPNLLASIAASLPTTIADVMITRVPTSCAVSHGGMHNACSRHEAAEQLLLELRALPLYKATVELVGKTNDLLAERLVMLLLMAPESSWSKVPSQYHAAVLEMLNPASGRWPMYVIATEVKCLRTQLGKLVEMQENDVIPAKEIGCGGCGTSCATPQPKH